MIHFIFIGLLCFVEVFTSVSLLTAENEGAYLYREPFYWGVATAAYQTEGANSEDGRGLSIWDTFSAIPGKISHGDNGDIADDSYHKVMEDIQLLKSLGVNSYRFSISWTRIFPDGVGVVNQAGIDHYNKVLDALLTESIEPFVTLYHWDLPQSLEDRYGGLLNSQFVSDFVTYADICFKSFGSKVRHWITINEPWTVSYVAYGEGGFAPGRCSDRSRCSAGDTTTESYVAAHNLLNAHAAAAYHYKHNYQGMQHGLIGITLNQDWSMPFDPTNAEDIAAAERRREFVLGWFADPLFFGHYPASMVDAIGDRLPRFTTQESFLLQNSLDFLGINHYTSKFVLHRNPGGLSENERVQRVLEASNAEYFNATIRPFFAHLEVNGQGKGWIADQLTVESAYSMDGQLIGAQGGSSWLQTVPEGFYQMLMWMHHRYSLFFNAADVNTWPVGRRRPPFVYVTENGCDILHESKKPFPEVLQDDYRINYFTEYLKQLDRAIKDGAQIKGYFAWSLLDNFEWADGFDMRFGLHYVNFSDPSRPRYPKASAGWYREYIASMRTNYTGTERVIVPPHRPVYPPIYGYGDEETISVNPSSTLFRATLRSSMKQFWERLGTCAAPKGSVKGKRKVSIADDEIKDYRNEEKVAVACTWFESFIASYLSQTILQANWPHGDLL